MAARKKAKKRVVKRKTVKRKVAKRKTVKRKTVKRKTVKRKATPKRKAAKKRTAPRRSARTVTPQYVHHVDKPTAGLGIIVLLLNAIVLPGLGSLIGKRINAGLVQLILAILGQVFLGNLVHSQLMLGWVGLTTLQIVGLALVLVSWIWGILTGILVIKDSF